MSRSEHQNSSAVIGMVIKSRGNGRSLTGSVRYSDRSIFRQVYIPIYTLNTFAIQNTINFHYNNN